MRAGTTLRIVGLITWLVLPFLFLRGDDLVVEADEKLLKEAGLGSDGPGLLAFLRRRTLTEADRQDLQQQILQLGSADFAIRERATQTLTARGTPALRYLREAVKDTDPEISRRAAQCLEEIEAGPGPGLPAAAVRLLAVRKPPEAITTLLRYLPFADDAAIEEEALTALVILDLGQAKVHPALFAALQDPSALQRAAAAYVLGQRPDKDQREPVRQLLKDNDPLVQLRAAQALALSQDKTAVPVLVSLLDRAPPEVTWQAEEFLLRLAGDQAPNIAAGAPTPEARRQWREAWANWWRDKGAALDLSTLRQVERQLGLTVVAEPFSNRVWECGPDGKPRWQVSELQSPWDAQVLPGGRVLIAEYMGNRVTERDLKGKILWEKRVSGTPNCCQRLANGNTFITTNQHLLEVDRGGKEVFSYAVGQNISVYAAQKLRDGRVACGTSQGAVLFEGVGVTKEVKMTKLGPVNDWCRVEGLPGNRFLVACPPQNKVMELDGAGKVLWQCTVPGAASAIRLPNGRTLVASSSGQRVVEVDRAGKTVWEKTSDGQPWRLRRR